MRVLLVHDVAVAEDYEPVHVLAGDKFVQCSVFARLLVDDEVANLRTEMDGQMPDRTRSADASGWKYFGRIQIHESRQFAAVIPILKRDPGTQASVAFDGNWGCRLHQGKNGDTKKKNKACAGLGHLVPPY